METKFKNLSDIQKVFHSEEVCREQLERIRWNGNPACPHCGTASKPYKLKDGKTYKCSDKDCKQKFTVTVGTIFENTKLPLQKWFIAMYLVTSHKKGISSLQLSRDLGITQKAAWFVNHRIREMLRESQPVMLQGTVEIDETYVGGKLSNKHVGERKKQHELKGTLKGRPTGDTKTAVLGLVQRDGKLVQQVMKATTKKDILPLIEKHVKKGSTMHTDEYRTYQQLTKLGYKHETVAHLYNEYFRDGVHTNTIEGAFSLLKRGIIGIFHYVSAKHLNRYCDEFSYRYNTRQQGESERFCNAITGASGKRLKYQQLIGKK